MNFGWQGRAKGKTYGEHRDLVAFFLQQRRQWEQRCQRSERRSCFLLSGEMLVLQLVLAAVWG
jgi:hypothetical protein